MSIDSVNSAVLPPEEQPPLPPVPGGWRRKTVDLGWTSIELSVPATPDALLDTEEVQEANRRDDSMPYWATLWPAAEVMSRLLDQAVWPVETAVLEIGCGLGLVGIAGLKRGWQVHLTDSDPSALAAARHNSTINGFAEAKVSPLDWRRPPARRYPAILACDVLYESRHHQPVLDLIDAMLAPDGCCWIGDPGRTPLVEFYQTAMEHRFRVTLRDGDGEPCAFPARGQFQLLEVMRPE